MNPTIYIFENEQLKLVLSNDLPEGLPLLSAVLKEKINGENSLSFSVPSDHPDSNKVKRGDWAIIKHLDGDYRAFVIIEEEEEHSDNGFFRSFQTEELAVNELNDEIVTDVRPQDTTAEDALQRILENTNSRWQVGMVDDFGLNSINVYYESAMEGIKKVVETWGGELRFRITINEKNEITGRYIDLVAQLGRVTMKRFEYGKDLTSVTRFIDMKPLKTALYGRGKGEQTDSGGYGRRITFADVEWKKSNGDPVDKPLGQEWVGDPEALAVFGHLNADGTRRHRFGVYINEEQDDPEKLLKETWDHLQTLKQPHITYTMNVLDLEQVSADEYRHEAVRLGDTVAVIDRNFSWDVEIAARVVEIERDLINPANTKITLGNVLQDLSNLVKELQKRIDNKISFGAPIGWLEGIIDAARSEFHSRNGYVYITDKDGILITNRPKDNIDNPPDQAIQLKAGALAIADKRLPDGSFDFRTFITGDQVIADRINTGRIRTNNVEIADDQGKVLINGDGITIKGGAMKVYSTLDASDSGVLIEGNKINTNFIRNPDFDTPPGSEWTLYGTGQVYYDSNKKAIIIDTSSTMSYIGISQEFDVYHPRATFSALFKSNLFGGSTPKKIRFYLYNYDSKGNRLADRSKEDQLALFQDWHILNWTVDFPAGTTKSRLFVQVEMKYNMTAGMEIHWVKGYYDNFVTLDQLVGVPTDVYNYHAASEIQAFNIQVSVTSSLSSGTSYQVGRINWDKAFTPVTEPDGRIWIFLQPWGSNSTFFTATPFNPDSRGFTLYIRTLASISAGSTLNIYGLAYRAGYYGQYGLTL